MICFEINRQKAKKLRLSSSPCANDLTRKYTGNMGCLHITITGIDRALLLLRKSTWLFVVIGIVLIYATAYKSIYVYFSGEQSNATKIILI